MESIIGVLEGRDEDEKVEVLFDPEVGEIGLLSLRLVSWGEGIGWYPQKTVEIDCRHLGALQLILKRAGALFKTHARRAPESGGKVLPFSVNRPGPGKAHEKVAAFQETGS